MVPGIWRDTSRFEGDGWKTVDFGVRVDRDVKETLVNFIRSGELSGYVLKAMSYPCRWSDRCIPAVSAAVYSGVRSEDVV